MKKILSLVLALAMCLCLFAACSNQNETNGPSAPAATVEDAAEYLYAMYKEDNGSVVRRDIKRVAVVMIDGTKFDVVWSSDSADAVVGAVEKSMVVIDINEEPAADVTFTLTATVKDAAGNSKAVSFTHTILAPKASGTQFVDVPAVDTAYKFALQQNTLGKTLYFNGQVSGNYLAMSESPFDAVDVFVENVDGGQRIYFMDGETKTYIDIVTREDNASKVKMVLTETPTAVFTWDAERKTYTAKVGEETWYMGTYSTFNTISASATSYIENVEVIGDSQFPAGFCTVNITATQVKAPATGTAYKFALVQNTLGQTLYFTGEMSGYYLAMSQNPAEGVNIFVEDVDGGQRIYFMKGETKTYIDIVPREDNAAKVNVVLTETPSAVFTWDAERCTYTAKVGENTWYLGTYSTFNTISASNVSYIENMEVIGDTQFPAGPYIVDGFMEMQPEFGGAETPDEPEQPSTSGMITKPVAGTAYKLGLVHGGKGDAMMYLTGAEKPNYPWYLLSTTNVAEAVDVFVENVDGGLRLYFMVSGTKTYLDMHKDDTHYSLRLTTEPTAVYTWNTEHNTFVTTVEDKECFIGTSGTFDTFSCNTMDKVANSYVAHLYGEGGTTPETPSEPETPTEKPATLAEQIAEANNLANNTYLSYESTITGTITDDPIVGKQDATAYKFTVSDGTNSLLCYYVPVNGTPKKGDTVTVTGKLTAYNGSAQFDKTATATLMAVPGTLAEQIAEANKLANKEYLPYESTITGTITDDPAQGKQDATAYKFTVSDGTNSLLCYYVPVNGTPKKGDTITVTGKLTAYNGSAQFDSTAKATLAGGSETPETPEEPEAPAVTGTATLAEKVAVGDKIVLVNAAGDSAMGAQNDKKREATLIVVTDKTASLNANVVIITLEKGTQEGTFALKVADGYLAYNGSGNSISTQETVDDAASWTITIVDGVVTIQNVGYAERFLQYNASNPRFVCYKASSNQEAPVIYKVEE